MNFNLMLFGPSNYLWTLWDARIARKRGDWWWFSPEEHASGDAGFAVRFWRVGVQMTIRWKIPR